MSTRVRRTETMTCDGCGKRIDRGETIPNKYFCSGKKEAPLAITFHVKYDPPGDHNRDADFCSKCLKITVERWIRLARMSLKSMKGEG